MNDFGEQWIALPDVRIVATPFTTLEDIRKFIGKTEDEFLDLIGEYVKEQGYYLEEIVADCDDERRWW